MALFRVGDEWGVPGLRVRVDGVGLCAAGGEGFLALLTIDGPQCPLESPPPPHSSLSEQTWYFQCALHV